MPDLTRFLTRAREDLARYRGATDWLCGQRATLHPHPRPQAAFMEAMREVHALACLKSQEWAQLNQQAGVEARQLRLFTDLQRLPPWEPVASRPRELRRWHRVASHALQDLGWSRRRRQALSSPPELLGWYAGRLLMARCAAGRWHWPRPVEHVDGWLFSPVPDHPLALPVVVDEAPCPCGRGTHCLTEEEASKISREFLPLALNS